MGLFNFKKKKPKSIMDALNANPAFQKQKVLYDAMSKMCENGTEEDFIPNGLGEFGYEVTNPIPVNTVFGSTAYLGRLRTPDGTKVEYTRIGSTSSPNINMPIDIYRISAYSKEIAILYISPYHKRNSKKAPKGFEMIKYAWDEK
jgi:hypothetical protein